MEHQSQNKSNVDQVEALGRAPMEKKMKAVPIEAVCCHQKELYGTMMQMDMEEHFAFLEYRMCTFQT
jgi:hypothetical protein